MFDSTLTGYTQLSLRKTSSYWSLHVFHRLIRRVALPRHSTAACLRWWCLSNRYYALLHRSFFHSGYIIWRNDNQALHERFMDFFFNALTNCRSAFDITLTLCQHIHSISARAQVLVLAYSWGVIPAKFMGLFRTQVENNSSRLQNRRANKLHSQHSSHARWQFHWRWFWRQWIGRYRALRERVGRCRGSMLYTARYMEWEGTGCGEV